MIRSATTTMVAIAALIAPGIANAAGIRQTADVHFTTTHPGAASGTVLSVDFVNPDNPDQKPYSVARFVTHYPAGTVIDTTVPPQCKASDAELQVEGPSACPPDSRIGGGNIESDTGSQGGFPRYTETTVSLFNNQGEQIGVGSSQSIPFNTVTRSKIQGRTITSDVPPFPGTPPPEPYTPFDKVRLSGPAYVRDGRAYVRTPPTCPASGHWTFRVGYTYRDGVTQSTETPSPCKHRKARKHRRHHRHHR